MNSWPDTTGDIVLFATLLSVTVVAAGAIWYTTARANARRAQVDPILASVLVIIMYGSLGVFLYKAITGPTWP